MGAPYALMSRSNSGSSSGSLATSKKDIHQWLSQSVDSNNQHLATYPLHIPLNTSSYPEMLQVTDNLRATVTQKLTRVEDLLKKGEVEKLVKELENVELLHQQLVGSTGDTVALLPNEHSKRIEMAELDALESKVGKMKEQVYSYLATTGPAPPLRLHRL